MKPQKWNESIEGSKDFLEFPIFLSEEEAEVEIRESAPKAKTHLTELRRRIEERMECKRIDLEFEWD